jgi:hypothetical protein
MSDESTLRAKARRLMQAGKLPNRQPDRIWGGQGTGTPCTVCNSPVRRDQAELEVEWSEGASKSNHHLHAFCFAALELEIREGELAHRPLAAGGQGQSVPAAPTAD